MRNDIVQRRQVNLVNVLMVTHPPRTAKDASHSTIADLPAPERERLRLQIAGIVERDVYPEWRNAIALLETLLPRTTGDAGMFEASEVERYVVNPGQACSYMIGQLKILELRDKARSALGSRFSERAFHDAVLGAGILPLTLLVCSGGATLMMLVAGTRLGSYEIVSPLGAGQLCHEQRRQ